MPQWLSRIFGGDSAQGAAGPAAPATRTSVPAHAAAGPRTAASGGDGRGSKDSSPLNDADFAFLSRLISPTPAQTFTTQDDRAFIDGIQKRIRNRELELPVVPEMAMRLSGMMRQGAPVSEFAKAINTDAAAAVEVLKIANSAYYGGDRKIASLQDAIVRIGFDRLQSVLMLAHLHGKVFKPGPYQRPATLLLEMALPLGDIAGKLAAGRHADKDACFMRGVLLHVEHLVIIGSVSAITRDLKRSVRPSQDGLHEALSRFGGTIRETVAAQWNLGGLLLGEANENGVVEEYALLRKVLICRWLRLPMPPEASVFGDQLEAVMATVPERFSPGSTGIAQSVPFAC